MKKLLRNWLRSFLADDRDVGVVEDSPWPRANNAIKYTANEYEEINHHTKLMFAVFTAADNSYVIQVISPKSENRLYVATPEQNLEEKLSSIIKLESFR